MFLCSPPSSVYSFNYHSSYLPLDSLVVQMVKSLPTMQETWVQSLDQEDPLEKGMATHCSILAWKIPWRSLVGYSPWGHKESDTTEWLHFHFTYLLTPQKPPDIIHDFLIGHSWGVLWWLGLCRSVWTSPWCLESLWCASRNFLKDRKAF